jgi:hypothetical protein
MKTKQKQNVWKPRLTLKVEEVSVVRVLLQQLQVHLSVVFKVHVAQQVNKY